MSGRKRQPSPLAILAASLRDVLQRVAPSRPSATNPMVAVGVLMYLMIPRAECDMALMGWGAC